MADALAPEQLMQLAENGHVPKDVLLNALAPACRRSFMEACAAIERQFTADCDATKDPCLESGCSVDHEHGEACLQPILRAEADYQKACGAEWVKLFRTPQNRNEAWRNN